MSWEGYFRDGFDLCLWKRTLGWASFALVLLNIEGKALLNIYSRYLHDKINALAKELLEALLPAISVLHFVNSGSEANKLAIRMAKAATGERDIIASDVGYHGNTNMTDDISLYKFDGKGGQGAPEYSHIFPLADAKLHPLGKQADYLANRMKDHGIVMSTDGPDHNVLNIKPPMVFTQENVEELLFI